VKMIPLLTEDELLLVKEYVLLPIILDVLERDIKLFSVMPFKMSVVYMKSLRSVQDEIFKDMYRLRKELGKHGIKVYEQRRTKLGIEAEYLCKGYRHTFSMLWSLVKAEVEKKLMFYMHVD
jgi:hypothetical protein